MSEEVSASHSSLTWSDGTVRLMSPSPLSCAGQCPQQTAHLECDRHGTQRGWGHSVWDAAPAFEGLGPLEEAGPQAPCAASNMVAQVADSMVSSGGWKRGGLHLQLGSLGLSAGPQSSFADGWAPGPHLCLDGCFYGSVLRASRWDFIWGKSSIAFIKRIADLGGILHREEVCGTLCGSCLNWGIPPSVSVILSYLLLSLKIIDEKRVWRQYNVCN